jgi:hypothetical protein
MHLEAKKAILQHIAKAMPQTGCYVYVSGFLFFAHRSNAAVRSSVLHPFRQGLLIPLPGYQGQKLLPHVEVYELSKR